ncbi:hypothetical protein QYM36_017986 [Artemia franciscana]|uniref:Uncharacterized protein n=1 Tax=Artemia franciscana TaxID=6661 RepID=A0AA88HAR0_ARTSF|nr:hypothetical protein QYM36_017986 [Artemia franciscana]
MMQVFLSPKKSYLALQDNHDKGLQKDHYSSQPNDDNRAQFMEYRNKTNSLRRRKMKKYYATYFEENKNDPKKTWKSINEVIKGMKKKQIIAIQTNDGIAEYPVEVAELFANHFSNIGKMIQSKIPSDQSSTLEFEDNQGDRHQWAVPSPKLIFQRKKFQPHMHTGAPANSAGGASHSDG